MNRIRLSLKRNPELLKDFFGQSTELGPISPIGAMQRDFVRPVKHRLPMVDERQQMPWATGAQPQKQLSLQISQRDFAVREYHSIVDPDFSALRFLFLFFMLLVDQRLELRLASHPPSLLVDQRVYYASHIRCKSVWAYQIARAGTAPTRARLKSAQDSEKRLLDDIATGQIPDASSGEAMAGKLPEQQSRFGAHFFQELKATAFVVLTLHKPAFGAVLLAPAWVSALQFPASKNGLWWWRGLNL